MNLTELQTSPRAALTVTDVAALLEVDERTIRRACEDGQLPCLRIGRLLRIPRLPLLALLQQGSREMSEAGPASPATATTDLAANQLDRNQHDTRHAYSA